MHGRFFTSHEEDEDAPGGTELHDLAITRLAFVLRGANNRRWINKSRGRPMKNLEKNVANAFALLLGSAAETILQAKEKAEADAQAGSGISEETTALVSEALSLVDRAAGLIEGAPPAEPPAGEPGEDGEPADMGIEDGAQQVQDGQTQTPEPAENPPAPTPTTAPDQGAVVKAAVTAAMAPLNAKLDDVSARLETVEQAAEASLSATADMLEDALNS